MEVELPMHSPLNTQRYSKVILNVDSPKTAPTTAWINQVVI
jgi:hypothetical protein